MDDSRPDAERGWRGDRRRRVHEHRSVSHARQRDAAGCDQEEGLGTNCPTSVDLLAPRAIIAMGKKAGGVVKRWYAGALPVYCVPRTNGDSYVSDAAKVVHEQMKSELTSQR